jgi:hypothetical protein
MKRSGLTQEMEHACAPVRGVPRNVILDGDWCIEEVEIIFIKVKGHSSSIHKVNENEIEFGGFLSSQIV